MRCSGQAQFDESGRPLLLAGTGQDVTERRRLEAARRVADARFANTFADASIGLALLAPDGRIIRANRTFEAFVGQPSEQLAGRTLPELTHASYRAAALAALERTIGEDVELQVTTGRGCCPVRANVAQLERVLLNLALNARAAMPGGGLLELHVDPVTITGGERHGGLPAGRYAARRGRHGDGDGRRRRGPGVRAVLLHEAQQRGHRPRARDGSTAWSGSSTGTSRSAAATDAAGRP